MGVPLGGSGFSSFFVLAADPILAKSPNASVNDDDDGDTPPTPTAAPGLVGEDAEKEGMGVKPPLLMTGVVVVVVTPPPTDGLGGGGGVASAKGLPADAVLVIIGGCIGEGIGAVA